MVLYQELRVSCTVEHVSLCATGDLGGASTLSGLVFLSPISLPPGFQPALMPPNGTMLVPRDPAGQQMIGQHKLFKWPTYVWCLGRISAWNTNPKCKVCKQTVKSTVFYPDDGSSQPHCVSLDNYNTDIDNESPNQPHHQRTCRQQLNAER